MTTARTERLGALGAPASSMGRRLRSAVLSRPAREGAIVLLAFGALAVLLTWPLATEFNTEITGGDGGDASGYVWDLWYNATHGLALWGASTQEVVSAPYGRILPGSANALLLVTLGPAWVVAKLASPIAAYNVAALSGLALSGASMYLLIRWLGLGIAPAIWGGISFALFPYELIRNAGHVPLSHIECFPLMLMASVHWVSAPSRRRALLLALALAFGWLSNPYYGLMCTVIAAVAIVWAFAAVWRGGGLRSAAARAGEAVFALVLLVGVPLLALVASSRDAADVTFKRDPIELEIYGARLTDYVRPVVTNPFWTDILGDPFPSAMGERANYLGAVTVVLAVVGLTVALRRRTRLGAPRATGRGHRRAARPGADLAQPRVADAVVRGLDRDARIAVLRGRAVPPRVRALRPGGDVRGRGDRRDRALGAAAAEGRAGHRRHHRGWSSWRRSSSCRRPSPSASNPPVTVAGRAPDQVPTWAWLADNEPEALVFEMPGRANEAIERYYMYGQLTHGHRILNGNLFAGQLGYDVVNQVGLSQLAQQRALAERDRHRPGHDQPLGLCDGRAAGARSGRSAGRLPRGDRLPRRQRCLAGDRPARRCGAGLPPRGLGGPRDPARRAPLALDGRRGAPHDRCRQARGRISHELRRARSRSRGRVSAGGHGTRR